MNDPGKVVLRRAARSAIVIPLAQVVTDDVLGLTAGGIFAVFGCFGLTVLSDFGGSLARRARAYLIAGAAGVAAIALGTVIAAPGWLWLGVASMMIFGFAAVFFGQLRGYFAAATTTLIMPFAIAVTGGPHFDDLLPRMAGWAIATVLAATAGIVLWPAHGPDLLRARMADALAAAAACVRATGLAPAPASSASRDPESASPAQAAALDHYLARVTDAHSLYDGCLVRPGPASRRDRALGSTMDSLDRMRSIFRWPASCPAGLTSANRALAEATSAVFDNCAAALAGDAAAPPAAQLHLAREIHREHCQRWVNEQSGPHSLRRAAADLRESFGLRLASMMAELIASDVSVAAGQRSSPEHTEPAPDGSHVPESEHQIPIWQTMRANLTVSSAWFRNSARAAVGMGIAVALVGVMGLQHGFWVILGMLAAIGADAITTRKAAPKILAGTVIGFAAALAVVALFHDNLTALWVLYPMATFLSTYGLGALSVVAGQTLFTVWVIILFSINGSAPVDVARIRLLDISVGLGVGLIVSFALWPRGTAELVGTSLGTAMRQAARYLTCAYQQVLAEPPVAPPPAPGDQPPRRPGLVTAEHDAVVAARIAADSADLALAQIGAESELSRSWACTANVVAQVVEAADIAAALTVAGQHAPADPALAQAMSRGVLTCTAHLISAVDPADVYVAEIARILGPAEAVMRPAVDHLLDEWSLHRPPGVDAGAQLYPLMLRQSWLIYLDRLADQIGATGSRDPAVVPAGSAR